MVFIGEATPGGPLSEWRKNRGACVDGLVSRQESDELYAERSDIAGHRFWWFSTEASGVKWSRSSGIEVH